MSLQDGEHHQAQVCPAPRQLLGGSTPDAFRSPDDNRDSILEGAGFHGMNGVEMIF